jgi:hypothetical protein
LAANSVNGWLLATGAVLAGTWAFLRYGGGGSSPITLAEAREIALAHAEEYMRIQRLAGFFVNLVGVLYLKTFTGKPPYMPQIYWDSIVAELEGRPQDLHYVQVTIAYVPPGAGGGENLIYGIEFDGHINFLAATSEALINWF